MVYPIAEEELIDFLNRCKIKNFEVTLCLYYNAVFNKEVYKELEKVTPYNHQSNRFGRQDKKYKFVLDKRDVPPTNRL